MDDTFGMTLFSETAAVGKKVKQKSRFSSRQSAINLAATGGLLGGTWLTGYFVLFDCVDDSVKVIAGYLFIVLNASQGVFVLCIHMMAVWHAKLFPMEAAWSTVKRKISQLTG